MGRLLFVVVACSLGLFVGSCYLSHTIDDVVDPGPDHCAVGQTEPVPCGRCGAASRVCGIDGMWEPPGECTAERSLCPVDVMLLADITGSHTSFFQASTTTLLDDLLVPLETDADVRVGISAFADYPVSPYGASTDFPFVGVLEPTHDSSAVSAAISTIMFLGGNDQPEGEIEGLNDLSGGVPHPTARPFGCAAGTVPGGCWRDGSAWRVVIVMTDTASHDLPGTSDVIVKPYGPPTGPTLSPREPRWATVRAHLIADGTYVYWIVPAELGDPGSSSTDGVSAEDQARALATQLGEDPDEAVATYVAGSVDASSAVPLVYHRVVDHFGIRVAP